MSAYINILQHPDNLPHEVTPIQKLELQSEDYMEKGVEEKTLFNLISKKSILTQKRCKQNTSLQLIFPFVHVSDLLLSTIT
jgi:hypothetical protein